MKKTPKITLPRIILFVGLILIAVYFAFGLVGLVSDINFPKSESWQIPLNDSEASYVIDCDSGVFAIRFYKEGHEKNGIGVFVGSSPEGLEQFCGKNVVLAASAREKRGYTKCVPGVENCEQYQTVVVDILEVREKP